VRARVRVHQRAVCAVPADTIRLLLVLGARCVLPDKEGCTPLHWAAIRGHTEACTVLLQGGGEEALTQPDSTGCTPSQLAIEKGHRLLGLHLAEFKYRQVCVMMFIVCVCVCVCVWVGLWVAGPGRHEGCRCSTLRGILRQLPHAWCGLHAVAPFRPPGCPA
jgi:hypothetical protein